MTTLWLAMVLAMNSADYRARAFATDVAVWVNNVFDCRGRVAVLKQEGSSEEVRQRLESVDRAYYVLGGRLPSVSTLWGIHPHDGRFDQIFWANFGYPSGPWTHHDYVGGPWVMTPEACVIGRSMMQEVAAKWMRLGFTRGQVRVLFNHMLEFEDLERGVVLGGVVFRAR
jgi:hypothetical protein